MAICSHDVSAAPVGTRVTPRIVSGTGHPHLAEAVAADLGTQVTPCLVERFPDGELRPVVDPVRGDDVYVLQPTGPPVNDHLVELMLLLDACRRDGAARVTAVVPYFGYARQDRRDRRGAPIAAHVAAAALTHAGADRIVVVDPHTTALEAMSPAPVETITAVPFLARSLAPSVQPGTFVVAPDLGAVKLAERYGQHLGLPVAVVRKARITAASVRAEGIVGDPRGHPVVIVDDMISTGATIAAALDALSAAGADPRPLVAATHLLAVDDAVDRLASLPVLSFFVTNSTPTACGPPLRAKVTGLTPLLARAIRQLHQDEPLADLVAAG